MKYTNSTAGKIYNEMTDLYLDEQLDNLERNVENLRLKIKKTSIFTRLQEIGISPGTETAEKIALNLPPNSILIYHKSGDAVAMYPERTGLLVVTKGDDQGRVDFKFKLFDREFTSFYDAWRGTTELWSNWSEIVLKKNGVIECTSFGKSGTSINMLSSLDGNGKNLGWSGSKFKQVSCEAVYADNITGRIDYSNVLNTPYGGQRTRITQKHLEPGYFYFNNILNKPLWWTGENWVDAFGEVIKEGLND